MSSTSEPKRVRGRHVVAAACAWILAASPGPVDAAGINLSWDDCGSAGAELKTFACDASTGAPFVLVGSFVPPAGMPEFLGLNAEIGFQSSGALPDWWKHGNAQCRGLSAIGASFDFTSGPFTCADFYQGQAAGGSIYEVDWGGPNEARLRITCAVPFDLRGTVDPSQEYYAFKAFVTRARTTGAGACAGCEFPVLATLREIQLFQPPEQNLDPVLTTPLHRTTARWQGTIAPPAVITSLTPAAGAPGTPVTIRGLSLGDVTAVDFAGTPAAFAVASDTVVTTIVPAGARTGLVRVADPVSAAFSPTPFVVAPAVVSFVPAQAPIGHTVEIRGYNFTGTTAVAFAGIPATFTFVADSAVWARVPEGTTSGPIAVTSPGGTGTSAADFVVGPPLNAPSVTAFTPVAGAPGLTVTITGQKFTDASSVTFGGQPGAFTRISDTRIDAVVPGTARTGRIGVVNLDGPGESDSIFVVSPRITAMPTQAPVGHLLEIHGVNFTRTLAVAFGGSPVGFEEVSDVLLRTVVPPGASGPVTVTNAGGSDSAPFTIGPPLGGGINLAWDDCGLAGTRTKTFSCGTNAGAAFDLVGSFVPPVGITEFLGLQATLNFDSEAALLPDWWRHGSGQCRGTSGLATDFRFAEDSTCRDPYGVYWPNGTGVFEIGAGGPDRAQLRLASSIPFTQRHALESGVEHYAFRVRLRRENTTSCAGCDVPMRIELASIQLLQNPALSNDPVLLQPLNGVVIDWLGPDRDASPYVLSFAPASGAAGTVVTLRGWGFTGATSVRFGATPAAAFTVASDSVVLATVPPDVWRTPIEITTPLGTAVSDLIFGPPFPAAEPGGINLSWDDCGPAGTALATFACDTNEGPPFTLVASFGAPAGIVEFIGINAQIDLRSSTSTLPDYWRHADRWNTGALCRGATALTANTSFGDGPYTCADPWEGIAMGGWVYEYPVDPLGNRTRIRTTFAIPYGARHALEAGVEHYGLRVQLARAKTTGAGACAGCDVPMCLVLDNVQVFQPPEQNHDPMLTAVASRSFVHWQQTMTDCPASTPALAAVADVQARSDRVTIVWQLEGLEQATVQRRAPGGTWQTVAERTADGLHRVTYEDRAVIAGATYAYRLGLRVATGEHFAGETEVVVPGIATLALERAVARDGALTVSLTLPSAAPATLEAYDVFGRRWASRRVAPTAAGELEVELRGGPPFRAGVWFLRLRQGEATVSRRFVVVP